MMAGELDRAGDGGSPGPPADPPAARTAERTSAAISGLVFGLAALAVVVGGLVLTVTLVWSNRPGQADRALERMQAFVAAATSVRFDQSVDMAGFPSDGTPNHYESALGEQVRQVILNDDGAAEIRVIGPAVYARVALEPDGLEATPFVVFARPRPGFHDARLQIWGVSPSAFRRDAGVPFAEASDPHIVAETEDELTLAVDLPDTDTTEASAEVVLDRTGAPRRWRQFVTINGRSLVVNVDAVEWNTPVAVASPSVDQIRSEYVDLGLFAMWGRTVMVPSASVLPDGWTPTALNLLPASLTFERCEQLAYTITGTDPEAQSVVLYQMDPACQPHRPEDAEQVPGLGPESWWEPDRGHGVVIVDDVAVEVISDLPTDTLRLVLLTMQPAS